MIEDEIFRLVSEHYSDPQADTLLLSSLGKILVDKNLWPIAGEKRTLLDVLDKVPSLAVVRDKEAASFIAVVLKGDELRAQSAIADRHKRNFLRGLARPVLLAFTLDVAGGEEMYMHLSPRISFQIGSAMGQGAIIVDRDLRVPGLDVDDLGRASVADVERIEMGIRTWCERHNIDPSALARSRRPHIAPQTATLATAHATDNALARLYAAQPPDIAKRLIIPADIALLLSRLP